MRTIKNMALAATGAVLVAVIVAACGSSGSPAAPSGPASGSGLTQPTSPTGARMSGGTVYFTEWPKSPPNYIFPMYTFAVCSTANVNQFIDMMYRPLYWYGNDYRPTVDYDYSIGRPPVFSDGDRTVTIKLNPWRWSDGEAVTGRDLVFWMNVLKASPATEWCGYVPSYFPDNVTSYSAPDPQTFVMHLNKPYDPEWFLYNELSQLTPLPLAWDRTSLSQPAPTSDNGHLPDTTKAGARAIYKFLDGQARKLGSWTTSPLWRVVDGPFKLQRFTNTGEVTLVPNPSYSGSPKPTIAKLVELSFDSDAASYFALRSGGPSSVTIANIPPEYASVIPTLAAEGYDVSRAGKLRVQLLSAELQLQRPNSAGRRAGPVRLQAGVLPPGAPAPRRPARVDQGVLPRHRERDVRPDPAGAAKPARQRPGLLDAFVRVLGLRRPAAVARQRLACHAGRDDHMREPRDGSRRMRRRDQSR